MKTRCNKCIYGSINFWGYKECWKFDTEIDMYTTKHTAEREKDSRVYNHNSDCIYFETRNIFVKLVNFIKGKR